MTDISWSDQPPTPKKMSQSIFYPTNKKKPKIFQTKKSTTSKYNSEK